MRKSGLMKLVAPALMVASLLIGSLSVAASENTNIKAMKLSRQLGTVAVVDNSNKSHKGFNDMELLSGYSVATSASSYAWLNLDGIALVNMDALSRTRVTKSNNNLVLDLLSGNMFLDVSGNLQNGEILTIRTPNTVACIMGTAAEVRFKNGKTQILCLDGKIDGYALDIKTGKTTPIAVAAGKNITVESTNTGLKTKSNSVKKKDISGFSKLQIAQSPLLKARVIKSLGEKTGNIDLMDALTSTQKDINDQFKEIVTMANASHKDNQTVINAILGIDVSEKALVPSTPASSPQSSGSSSGSSDSDDSQSQHTHEWVFSKTKTPPTCTENGADLYKCKTCSETKTVSTKATGHSLEGVDKENITEKICAGETSDICLEIIIQKTWPCSKCGKTVEVIEQKYYKHSLEKYDEKSYAPTCAEYGQEAQKCTNPVCNEQRTCSYWEVTETIPALGHKFEYVTPFTPTVEACKQKTCVNCSGTEDIRHTWDESSLPATNEGEKTIPCSECGKWARKYTWDSESGKYEHVNTEAYE